MPTDRDLIAEAQALDATLTPGPWYAVVNDLIGGLCVRTADALPSAVPIGTVCDEVLRATDADCIARMRSILPEIIRRWESDGRDLRAHAVVLDAIMVELGITDGDDEAILPRIQQLLARVAERETRDDGVAGGFGIHSLAIGGGAATLTTAPNTEQARELLLAMSLACGRMLDDDQASNYVEFEVSPTGRPGYVVHVRRAAGPSPHTLRREAEERAATAEARIAELEAAQRPPLEPRPMAVSDFEHWLNYGERGLSAETIVAALTGATDLPGSRVEVNRQLPADAGDFWRCENLLRTVPEARNHLGLLAAESPEWAALVEHWDDLVALDCRALTHRIRALTEEVRP